MSPKSLHRSCAGRHFCGTENEIWAGFGPVGILLKKKLGYDYEQLLRVFFFMFSGAKNNLDFYIMTLLVRTLDFK